MPEDVKKPKEPKRGFNEKGDRVVIEISALREQYGKDEGERMYRELLTVLGGGAGSGIVTPLAEHERDLSLAGVSPTMREKAEAILASKGE